MDLLRNGDSVSTYGKFWADNYGRNLGGLEVWDLLKLGKIWGAGRLLTMEEFLGGGSKKFWDLPLQRTNPSN